MATHIRLVEISDATLPRSLRKIRFTCRPLLDVPAHDPRAYRVYRPGGSRSASPENGNAGSAAGLAAEPARERGALCAAVAVRDLRDLAAGAVPAVGRGVEAHDACLRVHLAALQVEGQADEVARVE